MVVNADANAAPESRGAAFDRSRFTQVLAQISEGAARRDSERVLPFAELALLTGIGFGAVRIPRSEGGGGFTIRELFEVVIDLSAADPNVAHILRTHFEFVERELHDENLPRREQRLSQVRAGKIFGNATTELGSGKLGSYAGQRQGTTLTRSGDHWLLNGRKFYSTGTLFADGTLVNATRADGATVIAVIPVDREGVEVLDDWDGFGQRLTGTGTTVFHDVRVDEEEISVEAASGTDQADNYYLTYVQLFLQAVTAGILANVRDDAATIVRTRNRSFTHASVDTPARDPQLLQIVGEIAADAYAARALVLSAAERLDEASSSVTNGVADFRIVQSAKLAAAETKIVIDRFAAATTTRLFDVSGASATRAERGFDRHWRNVRTISTHNPAFLKATAVGRTLVAEEELPQDGWF